MAFGKVSLIVFETSRAYFRSQRKAQKMAPSKSAALILLSVEGLMSRTKKYICFTFLTNSIFDILASGAIWPALSDLIKDVALIYP